MNVLAEILTWSASRPDWQRDALRRLAVQSSLTEPDLKELVEQCKGAHGLAEKRPSDPLLQEHLPVRNEGLNVVTLAAITHHAGVNALAPDQTVEFGPGLTIVYGDNAAGKSGYTRVLKRACRARGAEEILGNVLSGSAPGRPSATIRFRVGDKEQPLSWNDQEVTKHPLGNVSVFDSHCASVYLSEKTDVAFRPFGLDLFDKLSRVCDVVKEALEKERKPLTELPTNLPELAEGTAAANLVSGVTSLTKPEDVRKLGTLSEEEEGRLKKLRAQMKDLESDDPQKTAQALNLRAQRIEDLGSRLSKIDEALADAAIASLFDARGTVEQARKATQELRKTAFPPTLLAGTGSDLWRSLWEAARSFSAEEAYPEKDFPHTDGDVRCVLCQQQLQDDSSERLQHFEEFLQSTIQQELARAESGFKTAFEAINDLIVTDETSSRAIEELRIDTEELAGSIESSFRLAQKRRDAVVQIVKDGHPKPDTLPAYESEAEAVNEQVQALRDRAAQLLKNTDLETRRKLSSELQELEARSTLGKNVDIVIEEIERKKRLAAYQVCLQDTSTRGITRKSSEVTKVAVTTRLAASFQKELERLRFSHLEVELREAGGSRGALYHRLVLKRATGVEVPRVVSEGEARTLSIAAFFAELSTAADRCAILFDDPVSSLDHNWRDNVATRLAAEAKNRQVVVFTHDIAFLMALVTYAEKAGSQFQHQYLRNEGRLGAGVSSSDLPWIAMKVKDRIGVLKKNWQRAEKLHRTASRSEYEREASLVYGLLREAWERGLEEVLLGGVVERYRRGIQTQQAAKLSDITDGDCTALETGMTKCSRWLPGHDQSGAENVPVPGPDELKVDIESLENWVQTIRKRRN